MEYKPKPYNLSSYRNALDVEIEDPIQQKTREYGRPKSYKLNKQNYDPFKKVDLFEGNNDLFRYNTQNDSETKKTFTKKPALKSQEKPKSPQKEKDDKVSVRKTDDKVSVRKTDDKVSVRTTDKTKPVLEPVLPVVLPVVMHTKSKDPLPPTKRSQKRRASLNSSDVFISRITKPRLILPAIKQTRFDFKPKTSSFSPRNRPSKEYNHRMMGTNPQRPYILEDPFHSIDLLISSYIYSLKRSTF